VLEAALGAFLRALVAGSQPEEPPLPMNVSRREVVLTANAREQALLTFLPRYTRDLDEAMALVGELRALHAHLMVEVAGRFEQHALRMEREQDEFLGMVSHELRTPIHIFTGFASILLRDLGGPLTPLQRGYLEKMQAVAHVLARLVDDLIDLAQVGAGAFALRLVPMDFPPVARETLTQLAPLAAEKGLQLIDEVPTTLPPVLGDAQRLQQVLVNLVGNAIKFTPAGGTVRVTACVAGPRLVVEIHDTGTGIAPEDLEAIFERFVRRGPRTGGMGLGLAIGRAIVEGHGGTLNVSSTPGRGSTFRVELPLHQPSL
jgi:signal transduction histidine kinase